MLCDKCSIADRMRVGGEVAIHPKTTYLLDRLARALEEASLPCEPHHGTLVTRVDSFQELVTRLTGMVDLTRLEREKIMIAHLTSSEEYGPDLLSKTRSLAQWEVLVSDTPLLKVLQEKRIETHFQPIIDLELRRVFGYECLSRGVADDGSLIAPTDLLSAARETELLFNLDRLMRESSLRAAHQKGITEHFLFINFLPTSVYNPEFCLRSTVKWADELLLDPARIVFEVVETEKVEDNEHLISILEFYRKRGFQIALDDVAAGYSGLLQLLMIRPDIMKIDRELVAGVHEDEDKQAMIRAMMNVAEQYQIRALAEGVEEVEELAFLISQGVELAQGWLFSKPSPDRVTEADMNLESIMAKVG